MLCPPCARGQHDEHIPARGTVLHPIIRCSCRGDCAPLQGALVRLIAAGVIAPATVVHRGD